jgi:hypothetical protein
MTEDLRDHLERHASRQHAEAPECRSVCSPTVEGSFARFAAALSARSVLRGSQGSPSSVVNA